MFGWFVAAAGVVAAGILIYSAFNGSRRKGNIVTIKHEDIPGPKPKIMEAWIEYAKRENLTTYLKVTEDSILKSGDYLMINITLQSREAYRSGLCAFYKIPGLIDDYQEMNKNLERELFADCDYYTLVQSPENKEGYYTVKVKLEREMSIFDSKEISPDLHIDTIKPKIEDISFEGPSELRTGNHITVKIKGEEDCIPSVRISDLSYYKPNKEDRSYDTRTNIYEFEYKIPEVLPGRHDLEGLLEDEARNKSESRFIDINIEPYNVTSRTVDSARENYWFHYPCIAIDSNNQPHILVVQENPEISSGRKHYYKLRYYKWNRITGYFDTHILCEKVLIENGHDVPEGVTVVDGPNNQRYKFEPVVSRYYPPRLIIDKNDRPMVLFNRFIKEKQGGDDEYGFLTFATIDSGSFNKENKEIYWNLEEIDQEIPWRDGVNCDLAIDDYNVPHVCYLKDRKLKYSTKVNGVWRSNGEGYSAENNKYIKRCNMVIGNNGIYICYIYDHNHSCIQVDETFYNDKEVFTAGNDSHSDILLINPKNNDSNDELHIIINDVNGFHHFTSNNNTNWREEIPNPIEHDGEPIDTFPFELFGASMCNYHNELKICDSIEGKCNLRLLSKKYLYSLWISDIIEKFDDKYIYYHSIDIDKQSEKTMIAYCTIDGELDGNPIEDKSEASRLHIWVEE